MGLVVCAWLRHRDGIYAVWDEDVLVGVAEPNDGDSSLGGGGSCANSVGPAYLPKYDPPSRLTARKDESATFAGATLATISAFGVRTMAASVVMVDGSVKFIPWQYTTGGRLVIKALGTRNKGDVIDEANAPW